MPQKAIIYRPAKTAMQSGTAKTHDWKLDIISTDSPFIDPMMGWIGSHDTTKQLKLSFPTQEEAIQYATRKQMQYELRTPQKRQAQPKSYAGNFAANRRFYSDIAAQPFSQN